MSLQRRQLALALASTAALPLRAWSHAEPDEGIDYESLGTPMPTRSPGQIEVLEFFRYGCPFCDRMEAFLNAWKPRLATDVAFRKVPVSFYSTTHQQLYLTLVQLGQEARLGPRVFDTIHRQGRSLEMLMEISEWASQHGIAVARFEAAWHSSEVLAGIEAANAQVKDWGVKSVPQFGVNGRHLTSPAMVGGSNARALEVVDWLIAFERKASRG
ncbi:MAG: thiol:disulfide interchange protein DsbA/DsbL [Limnohabitans sp.]